MNYEYKNGFYFINDEELTEDEFFDTYEVCECCDNAYPKDEMVRAFDTGNWFCSSCTNRLYECHDCGDYIEEPCFFNDSGYSFCDRCYRDIMEYGDGRVCRECGYEFRYSDSGSYDRNDDWFCNACIAGGYGDYGSNLIGEYHDFKDYGNIEFCGREKRSNSVYMGFELEIDDGSYNSRDDLAKKINSRFDSFFHCEDDGSLNSGFEIISQPASLSYHLNNMSEYKEMFADIVNADFVSHDSGRCGLHIHLDNLYFGDKLDLASAKMLYIFEKHWDNLVRFSRRKSNQLHWCGKYSSCPSKTIKNLKCYGREDFDRYFAVNLSNYNTIEIRLWRGTLNPQSFEATLKFTARIAEICKKYSVIKISRMTFEDLLGDDEVIKAYWETVKNRNV